MIVTPRKTFHKPKVVLHTKITIVRSCNEPFPPKQNLSAFCGARGVLQERTPLMIMGSRSLSSTHSSRVIAWKAHLHTPPRLIAHTRFSRSPLSSIKRQLSIHLFKSTSIRTSTSSLMKSLFWWTNLLLPMD